MTAKAAAARHGPVAQAATVTQRPEVASHDAGTVKAWVTVTVAICVQPVSLLSQVGSSGRVTCSDNWYWSCSSWLLRPVCALQASAMIISGVERRDRPAQRRPGPARAARHEQEGAGWSGRRGAKRPTVTDGTRTTTDGISQKSGNRSPGSVPQELATAYPAAGIAQTRNREQPQALSLGIGPGRTERGLEVPVHTRPGVGPGQWRNRAGDRGAEGSDAEGPGLLRCPGQIDGSESESRVPEWGPTGKRGSMVSAEPGPVSPACGRPGRDSAHWPRQVQRRSRLRSLPGRETLSAPYPVPRMSLADSESEARLPRLSCDRDSDKPRPRREHNAWGRFGSGAPGSVVRQSIFDGAKRLGAESVARSPCQPECAGRPGSCWRA